MCQQTKDSNSGEKASNYLPLPSPPEEVHSRVNGQGSVPSYQQNSVLNVNVTNGYTTRFGRTSSVKKKCAL